MAQADNRGPHGRVGHYDNPYKVAEWSRAPGGGVHCEPLVLETPDRAIAHGWLYSRGGEDTVVCLMHPRANFSHHYVVPGLVERGYAVFCENSRWLNNDATLVHEVVLLDVAEGIRAMRERFDRVVLCGNSGGGSLYTFYIDQASRTDGSRLTDTAAGDHFDLNRFDLPMPDAMIYLAAHTGEGHFLLSAIDASVVNDADPLSCDPTFDPYDARNGFMTPPEPTHYPPEFVARYRAAQRARVERLDAEARRRVDRRHAARAAGDRRTAIATDFMCVYRTDADLRSVDPAIDPSERSYGSLWGARPDLINYGAVGFGRIVAPEAWLSTWSGLSSRANILQTGVRMTLPALMVTYNGDHCIFPSDHADIATALHSAGSGFALPRVDLPADHYGFPDHLGREPATAVIAEWLAG